MARLKIYLNTKGECGEGFDLFDNLDESFIFLSKKFHFNLN